MKQKFFNTKTLLKGLLSGYAGLAQKRSDEIIFIKNGDSLELPIATRLTFVVFNNGSCIPIRFLDNKQCNVGLLQKSALNFFRRTNFFFSTLNAIQTDIETFNRVYTDNNRMVSDTRNISPLRFEYDRTNSDPKFLELCADKIPDDEAIVRRVFLGKLVLYFHPYGNKRLSITKNYDGITIDIKI